MEGHQSPKSVFVGNIPSAEAMRERIEKRRDLILADLEDSESLVVEYHTPTGTNIRISKVGYYPDPDDALLLVGTDAASGDDCQVLVPVQTAQLIFRRVKAKGPPSGKVIGFFNPEEEEREQQS